MRRALVPLLRRLAGSSGCRLAASRLSGSGEALAQSLPASAAAAMLRQDLSSSRWFSAELGGGSGDASGGGGNTPGVGDTGAWEAVSRLSDEATEMAGEGDAAGAKKLLKEGLPGLVERFGAEDPAVGLIYNQLALWCFYDGQYAEAVEAAKAAHAVWVKEMGQDSQAATFHGIRLGMALAAAGHPEEAFPLLEKGLSVAVDNYNHHIEQLEGLMPLAEDTDAAAEGSSKGDDAAMAARAEQQRVSVAMLEKLGRALQEAKYYRALSFIGTAGREMDAKWDDNGAGAVFFLEQEMSDAVSDMLRWVMPDHPTVQCALREHSRLVAQCEKEGLRKLHDDLQIHNQRLQDIVHEAAAGKDG